MNIALVGYSRVGKDTVCELIQKMAVDYYHRVAFGDSLKDEMYRMFPQLKDQPKARNEMEIFGQMCREIQHDYWIEKLDHRIKICNGLDIHNFIVTDVRQLNEWEHLHKNMYKIVRVQSSVNTRMNRAVSDKQFNDIGESEKHLHLIPSDYVITNDGTLADLEIQVTTMLKEMGIGIWAT